MNFGPQPQPYCHPHTSAPIDLDRLEQINLNTDLPRARGRTTAFVVHMVGCALVAKPNQRWLYVADRMQAVHYARRMFLDFMHYEPETIIDHVRETRVQIKLSEFDSAVFDFVPLSGLENIIRGAIFQDYFLDCTEDGLYSYNYQHGGVLSSLPSRIEIDYAKRTQLFA